MSLTGLLFMLGFFAGVGLCLFRHPFWGLATYIAVYYLDAPDRWWGATLPNLRWSLLIALVTLISLLIHKRGSRAGWLSNGPIWVVIVYVAWMWVQLLWAQTGDEHASGLNIFSKYIIVLFLVYSIIDTKERALNFIFVHVLGCFYLGVIAYTTYTGGRLDGVGGPGISDSNSLGMQMGTAVLCGAGLYLIFNDWRKWVAAASVPFTLNTLVMTGSRGAFVALACGGLAMFLLRPRDQLSRIAIYIFLGAGLFLYLASDFFWDRIETVSTAVDDVQEVDQSVATRLELFRQQWRMAKDYPLGIGHKGTTHLSVSYLSEEHMSNTGGRSSHNTILSTLVDQGFIGALLWLLLMGLCVLRCRALRTQYQRAGDLELGWMAAAVFGALVVYWSAGMFAPLLKAEVYMWLIALVCAAGRLLDEHLQEAREAPAPRQLGLGSSAAYRA